MKLKFFIVIVFTISLFHPQIINAQKKRPVKPINTDLSSREIANKVLNSTVLIITQDENGNPISQGSGFVYRSGLVVSNLHVFERATIAIVKNVKTGETSKVIEVVGMNAKEDICVIKIDNTRFPALSLGNSKSVQTGDEIYVASNPKGLEGSFSKGIVSSLRGSDLFQIDAAISSGSSGGVVVNQKAEAVGIVKSSLVDGQNLNFAIPINKLVNLRLKFNYPLQLAGACAYTDREKEGLKGLVKKVVELGPREKIVNGKLYSIEPKPSSIRIYDIDGNEIETTVFDSISGELAWKFTFTYDENRLKTSMKEEYGNGETELYEFKLENGINNKLYTRHFSSEVGSKEKPSGMQIYDSRGFMTIWYIGGKKITFTYDLGGRVKEKIQFAYEKIEIRTRYR